jgi:hypothetical protein
VLIRGVDIPQALGQAHRDGRLVLFVGAGASMDPPSRLPSFEQLARTIAVESGLPADSVPKDGLDRFLGELDDGDVDVHLRVEQLVGVDGSAPNATHRAVAALALAGQPVRVVTTNYDHHLTTALAEAGADGVAEYRAPALPVGDDFTGVVYLHGKLGGERRHLVATDGDFGRAYMTDAWAARFLQRMFSGFNVLFIGYGHSDPVMTYLARGLGRQRGNRFALVQAGDEARWRTLGITPITYLVDGGSHAALPAAVAGWAEYAAMGLTTHRQRMADLVSTAPSLVPEDESYLVEALESPDLIRFFTEHARGADWLAWARRSPAFGRLFTTGESNSSPELAWWFAQHYVLPRGTARARRPPGGDLVARRRRRTALFARAA